MNLRRSRNTDRGADDQTFHDVIEGYCGALSYAPGETATVHVSTRAASYDVVVERWGAERSLVWAARDLPGTYTAPPVDADANGCGWPVSVEIPIDGLNAVFFRDPDGTMLELIEVPKIREG